MVRGPTELKVNHSQRTVGFLPQQYFYWLLLADFPSFFWLLATLTRFMGVATLYVATLTRSNFDPVATLTRSNFES
jgi:hypothetical protein